MSQMKVEECHVDMSAGALYVKKWHPDKLLSDIPIILLHDSLGSVAQWRNFPEQLAQKTSRTVIAYDRLGFGRSSARSDLPSVKFIEEEALLYFPSLKKSLGFNHYLLLGHSVGGSMAINIAANDKECDGLVTLAAQAYVEDITLNGIIQAKKIFAHPGQIARLEKWHPQKASWVLSAWTDRWLDDAFRQWSLDYCIKNVSCPVLAVHGDQDEYGSNGFPEFISSKTSGPATQLILKDCGHVPHKEKTEEVLNAIFAFI